MGFGIVKELSVEHSLRPTNKIFATFLRHLKQEIICASSAKTLFLFCLDCLDWGFRTIQKQLQLNRPLRAFLWKM